MEKLLSDEQHRLINELCDYVEANVAPENFDMGNYRSDDSIFDQAISIQELTKEKPDVNICGTAGCMIGYGPRCHPELHLTATDWDHVSDKYYDASDNLWDFMFGYGWTDHQNTPQGSVERIRLALEYDGKMGNPQWGLALLAGYGDDRVQSMRGTVESISRTGTVK